MRGFPDSHSSFPSVASRRQTPAGSKGGGLRQPWLPYRGGMDGRSLGLLIATAGVLLILVGGLVAVGAMGWFGRLPGDLRFSGDNVRIYAPLASMLVLSLVLTVLVNLLRRFF